GTGSVAYGQDQQGRSARAGGYGYLVDDRGGGFDLGRQAVQMALESQDGRRGPTQLWPLVCQALGAQEWSGLQAIIYRDLIEGRQRLAALAPLVGQAARAGDAAARSIVRSAGEALGDLAIGVARQLGLGQALQVYYSGAIYELGELLTTSLLARVSASYPLAELHPAQLDPLRGAVLLALRAAGVSLSQELLQALRQQTSPAESAGSDT
ncbi:MAG: hypothetical protein HY335_05725, partial [Deinococcus sp.]|nr:hypothetical protein [Deinococcus sp.]